MTTTTYTYNHSLQPNTDLTNGWLAHHDAAALRYMRARLEQHVHQTSIAKTHPPIAFLPEPDNRQHRVVLVDAAALQATSELTFVAFFGYKRPGIDNHMLDQLDQELIDEFATYPYLVSYSSLELSNGSWANLVLMSNPAGIAQWAESQRHAYAVREVAPLCYQSIRLHRGVLRHGLGGEGGVEFRRTKLFDFSNHYLDKVDQLS